MTLRPRRWAMLLVLLSATRVEARGTLRNRIYVSPADGAVRLYDAWTPPGWDGATRLPAILLLHGRGGSKTSFETAGYENAADASGVVLLFWHGRYQPEIGAFSTLYVDGKNGIPDETDVLACLDDAVANLAVDPDRVHLAGFSQGGKGALLIGLKNPSRFASIVDAAGPSDAFQGQLWAPSFPDFADAAGGPADGATGETLALWYAQSARFLLSNARNLPVALFHGAADTTVPDSTALFPYRNTHHIADTPGFSDARGATPTLSELHASDPDGYPFAATYLAGVGHDEETVLAPPALFAFVAGRSRDSRPPRVVARTYEARTMRAYWLEIAPAAPPAGRPIAVAADLAVQALDLATQGDQRLAIDLAAAGIDPLRRVDATLDGGSAVRLRLRGLPPGNLRVSRDGVLLDPGVYAREGSDLVLDVASGRPTALTVEPARAEPVADDDLLVPMMVDAPGRLGARFRTELVLASTADAAIEVEALLLTAGGAPWRMTLPARSTRTLRSADLLSSLHLAEIAAPLRIRAVAGDPSRLFASARVFNDTAAGTYGLSFPVLAAGASTLEAEDVADLFGGTPGHPSRTNASLFAPFGASVATVSVTDAEGAVVRSVAVTLAAGERRQIDDILAGLPGPARVSVAVASGRLQTYATVIDQAATNDPFRSPALVRTKAARAWTVPSVASARGRNGARFTSDLLLSAPDAATPAAVSLTYVPQGGGAPLTASTSVPVGGTRVVEDVLGSLFPSLVPGAGALRIASASALQVLAVTRSDSDAGPASQDLPAVRAGEEATGTDPVLFVGLTESGAARTNLVLASAGEDATVALSLVAEDGNRGSVEVALAAGEVRQLDSVAALFPGAPVEAGALLVSPRGGRVVASAVRIDNLTNDPCGLAPLSAASFSR